MPVRPNMIVHGISSRQRQVTVIVHIKQRPSIGSHPRPFASVEHTSWWSANHVLRRSKHIPIGRSKSKCQFAPPLHVPTKCSGRSMSALAETPPRHYKYPLHLSIHITNYPPFPPSIPSLVHTPLCSIGNAGVFSSHVVRKVSKSWLCDASVPENHLLR